MSGGSSGALGLALTPSKGCAQAYLMRIAPEPSMGLVGGPPVSFLFLRDLTYPYVRLSSIIQYTGNATKV